jgi:hypothetical protein
MQISRTNPPWQENTWKQQVPPIRYYVVYQTTDRHIPEDSNGRVGFEVLTLVVWERASKQETDMKY